jgi:hypothetical protein
MPAGRGAMAIFPLRHSLILQMVFFTASLCGAAPGFRLVSAINQGPVINGRMCVSASDTCFIPDDAGYIAVPNSVHDSAVFVFSAPGYQDTMVVCAAGDTMTVAMRPFEINDRSQEIVVVAPSAVRSEDAYRQSSVFISPGDLKTKAGAAQDIGRYIGSLPSAVSSLSKNFDNSFFIRGGRPSENIFLVDGIEMDNIDYFSQANGSGGPIGFVNTDNIRNMRFYAGNIPVGYPSSISSVVDIDMRNGSLNEAKHTAGLYLIPPGIILASEGPLLKSKISYLFSGRYVDLAPWHEYYDQNGTIGIPKLGDMFGKMFMLAGDNFDLSLTGVLSHSKYDYSMKVGGVNDNLEFFWNSMNQKERIFQGGAGIAAHYTGNVITHEAHASVSFRDGVEEDSLSSFVDTFFTRRYASNPVTTDNDYRVRYLVSARTALSLAEHDTLSAGLRASRNEYRFSRSDRSQYQGECIICGSDGTPDTVTVSKSSIAGAGRVDNTEYGMFADYAFAWGILGGEVGVRGDYFRALDDFAASPRLSISIKPEGAGVFSGSMGLYQQFPAELPYQVFNFYYQVFPNTPDDTLRRVERKLLQQSEPQRCYQASVGYDKFLWSALEARLEAYYKWYDHEYHYLSPTYQEMFYWNNEGKLALRKQDGKRRVYGIEVWIGNPAYKRFFYSLGASLFDVKNRYNDGTWCDDWTAVRYTYSFSVGACIAGENTLSFSVQGSGGRPYCPQVVALDCIARPYVTYDPGAAYYSGRLDEIIATNLRYSLTKRIGRFTVESFLEIVNVLNYQPTLEYQFNGVSFTEIKPFGYTPAAGCTVRW